MSELFRRLLSIDFATRGLAFTVRIFLCWVIFVHSSHGQNAFVLGSNCVIINQNVSGASTIEQDCPLAPEESFRVRYLWLDAVMTSHLMIGHFDSALTDLIGSSPQVIRNEVYNNVSNIVQKFGTLLAPMHPLVESNQYFHLSGKGSEAKIPSTASSNIPTSVLRKLRLYAGSERIVWPDLAALTTVIKTRTWPSQYSMSYVDNLQGRLDFKRNSRGAESSLLACVLLHAPVSKHQLASYWDQVDALEEAVSGRKVYAESTSVKGSILGNLAIDALQYFGMHNWPDDFLMAFGHLSVGCFGPDNASAFQFFAQPRQLYTLVAVVESKARTLDIEGITFFVDRDSHLRTPKRGSATVENPPGVISLKRGQSVIIPLRVELRYDLSESPMRSITESGEQAALKIYSAIASSPTTLLRQRYTPLESGSNQPVTLFEKVKTEFRKPQLRKVTESYVFGSSYDIRDLRIRAKSVSVRPAPANALSWGGNTIPGASCPFLFVDDDRGEPALLGRILIGSHGKHLARTEHINLPSGSKAITIVEQEPETTYLGRVAVISAGRERILAENVTIRPGHARSFSIPEEFRVDPVLVVHGYYNMLGADNVVADRLGAEAR
jgi:hypothetical protein